MYWYKPGCYRLLFFCLVLSGVAGCKAPIKEGGQLKYFDLKGFFAAEEARFNKLKSSVRKTVVHNGVSETKEVKITDWADELGLFADADINKPAWKNSYSVIDEDGQIIYRAKDPDLKVHEILIRTQGARVDWVLIFTRDQNRLYKTTSKLTYYPNTLYMIEIDQHVKLLGNNHYQVSGEIGK